MSQPVTLPVSDSISDEALVWLANRRAKAREAWAKIGAPKRKAEHWRYTNTSRLEKAGLLDVAPSSVNNELDSLPDFLSDYELAGLNSLRLVFVDGIFSAELSNISLSACSEEFVFSFFADAQAQTLAEIQTHLGSLVSYDQHVFAALHDSQLSDGIYIKVPRQTKLTHPIQLVWITRDTAQVQPAAPRLLFILEDGAEATLIEQFVGGGGQASLTNALSECKLGDNAQLRHYRLHTENETANHIGGVHFELGRQAQLESFHFALGGQLKRIDAVVHHRGEGAHCEMNGIYLPLREQHVDYHTCLEHAAPHCTSNEVFRGIVGDRARAVFNGRIHIHKDAQKTSAQLSNKNLLTSNRAEVDTKPELEIYADDVQCAHGATVAQLDRIALHYLRTRGVSISEAQTLLSFGFINELIDSIKNESIAEYLRVLVRDMFSSDSALVSNTL